MLNKFLAWGLGGRREVGPSEGCSKGISARREKRWPDSEEMDSGQEEATHGQHFHPACGSHECWAEVKRPGL